MLSQLQAPNGPYTTVSEIILEDLSKELDLPDHGKRVRDMANQAPGGAFDPCDLRDIPSEQLGYEPQWTIFRYPFYGLDWETTGLRIVSRSSSAARLPWLVIIHGGSANFYEFFLDPLNAPGLGQYLAQKSHVLLVNIPGNFKCDGWLESFQERSPAYLLHKTIPEEEIRLRNSIFTNRLILQGLKGLIQNETEGDCLIVGHSTSGELAYLALSDEELAPLLKGRFLGWGSGGPAGLRKIWEEAVDKRERSIKKLSAFPPMWRLRVRDAHEYAASGYIGPLNPCGNQNHSNLATAQQWLALEQRRRPNFKQVMQDMEHRGMIELRDKLVSEIESVVTADFENKFLDEVYADIFAANRMPIPEIKKGVWVVGKWDKGHWNRENADLARERMIVEQLRNHNSKSELRILLLDLPMSHYGHIEKPKELAGCLIAAARWLST
jgi:pimeloyl-ACP methyl ester carboxylesterase